MLVGDDPCSDVSLDEAIHNDAVSEHHAMIRLPGDEKDQTAVVAIYISGIDELCCDNSFLSLFTAENRLQTRNHHWNLVIDRVYLEKTGKLIL